VDHDGPAAAGGRGERPAPLREPDDHRQREALDAVVAVGRAHGLDVTGVGIWRAGSAVLVGLPAVPALARVDEPARAGDARRQVRVAEVLAQRAVPAVHVTGPGSQPVETAAGAVTIWAWEPPVGPLIGARVLGRVARFLHDRTRDLGSGSVAPHDPLVTVRAELARAAGAGATAADDLARLRAAADRLEVTWPDPADDPLGAAIVHGDLHRSNVVAGRAGPVLADLELAGWGPASADIAPTVVAVRRYGADPAALDGFLDGYGSDPRGWPGLEILVEAYELWVTVWAVANRAASPRSEREAEARLQRWRGGDTPRWTLR
jgi:hypothetical protein